MLKIAVECQYLKFPIHYILLIQFHIIGERLNISCCNYSATIKKLFFGYYIFNVDVRMVFTVL